MKKKEGNKEEVKEEVWERKVKWRDEGEIEKKERCERKWGRERSQKKRRKKKEGKKKSKNEEKKGKRVEERN